jgi:ABC-type nitrate/sulfonate/bicarbonate transport system substrate-binding protein
VGTPAENDPAPHREIDMIKQASMWVALALTGAPTWAQTPPAGVPVRIAVQPGNYSAIAYKVATQLGYWQDAGLVPSFTTFAAGIPQIKAHAEWDFATLGAVPALIGARDYDLVTIAVANDESRTNVLMGRKEFVAKLRTGNTIPNGTRFAVTLNSTGDYAAQTCLSLWGGKTKGEMTYLGMPQAEIMAAGPAGSADLLALWAPNSYAMEEKHGYEVFCSGKDFSPGVFGVTIANRKWAQANPELVSKVLAVTIRANRWIKRNAQAAQQIHIEGSAKEGVTLSATAARKDNELRPVFELDEQIQLMRGDRTDPNDSRVAQSFYSLNVFLNEGRLQTRLFRASSFVDASYLQRVRADPLLLQFIQRP